MTFSLESWLIPTAVVAFALAVFVAGAKLIHHAWGYRKRRRRSTYVEAVGELVGLRSIPDKFPRVWTTDVLFAEVLAEYRLSLIGSDREFIDDLVEQAGVKDALWLRLNRPRTATSRMSLVALWVELATETDIARLVRLLDHSDTFVAIHAAKGLSRIESVEVVSEILDRMVSTDPWISARLADSLVEFGPRAGPAIRSWIVEHLGSDPVPSEAISLAVRVLGLIGDPDSEPEIVSLMVFDDPDVRIAAASALGTVGSDLAVDALVTATRDESWPVRARAAASLGDLGDPRGLGALRPLLEDRSWWVRQNAAEAIAHLRGGTIVLVETLSGPDPYAADAALHQLAMVGAIEAAGHRIDDGSASETDRELIAYVRAIGLDGWHVDLTATEVGV